MKAVHTKAESPDALCRRRYRFLASECRRRGLDAREIEESRNRLSFREGSICYLREVAYKPTGIAAGCPLPDRRFTRRLWQFSRLAERYLCALSNTVAPAFAFVPPDFYHVTLNNRTHFDVTKASLMEGSSHMLSDEERRSAQAIIDATGAGMLRLHFNGLILTPFGRLIVPGFPSDDRLYEIRARLKKDLPQLEVNVPRTAHIKLGHILVHLEGDRLKTFLNWVARCAQHIDARVAFGDLYTPTGRIDS